MTPTKRTLNEIIEEGIDEGATTVEEIHKSIAALPLKILEQCDLLRGPTNEVRRVQHHTTGAVYDRIREMVAVKFELCHVLPGGAHRSSAERVPARATM